MGLITGLKAMTDQVDGSSDTAKGTWLTLKDGEQVKFRFLQEIDPDSENYNEEAGLAFMVVEHSNPTAYKQKALCTIDDEGKCFGCEQARLEIKSKWKGKRRFYANILVMAEGKDPYVAILSQGVGSKSATETIIQYAGAVGSITNTIWQIKRSGTGLESEYNIIPIPVKDIKPLDLSKYELFDLTKTAIRQVTYNDQENFYLKNDGAVKPSSVSESSLSHTDW